jgi:predicted short-subunit dehydrogenase-like oxidoreductase (DUF2520 family)
MDHFTAKIAVVGRGRLGSALAGHLALAEPPRGRGAKCADADVVLLCVPDDEIAAAAALIEPGRLVGHCSGATTLAPLAPHEAFSVHPLMTVTGHEGQGDPLAGAWAAVAGSTQRALDTALAIAERCGMRPFVVPDDDRAAYHASASIASNFVVTLAWAAERLGTDREALVPLMRAAIDNWERLGPEQALTGPVARGDDRTVARQRDAVEERAPDLLGLFDELVRATGSLAGREVIA